MKKQTKKHILEFLHFWPMTIVVPILLLLILFPGIAGAKSISDNKHDQFCLPKDVATGMGCVWQVSNRTKGLDHQIQIVSSEIFRGKVKRILLSFKDNVGP